LFGNPGWGLQPSFGTVIQGLRKFYFIPNNVKANMERLRSSTRRKS